MVIGKKPSESGHGTDYMMASESVALVQCGYKEFQDVLPGQAVIIEKGKEPIFQQVQMQLGYAPDVFEFVYFARPDTIIDGIDVDECRRNMGFKLAKTIAEELGPEMLAEVDAVMPLPETSIISALCVAEALKKPYVQGFVKNRYIFRTFIMPNQKQRQKGVRAKLNPMRKKFEGKNVLIVDDSIVRGTTTREIVLMAREAGAKKVILTSCAPEITYVKCLLLLIFDADLNYSHPHIYGIDLASRSELVAHSRSPNEIAKAIGADVVIYQTLEDLKEACAELSPRPNQQFEVGVFCGKYITPVKDNYFTHLDDLRGARQKEKEIVLARQAVVQGVANGNDTKVVLGAAISTAANKQTGKEVRQLAEAINGVTLDTNLPNGKTHYEGEEPSPRRTQDISLHNLNDHENDHEDDRH
jgi:amidophosphoribosyltransferase